MKIITTYYDNEYYAIQVDNHTTLERIEMTYQDRVPLQLAVKQAKKYMRWLADGRQTDNIEAVITNALTGEVLAELQTQAQ